MEKHISIEKLSYSKQVQNWLAERYGSDQAQSIWQQVVENYNGYLTELPDYGGKKTVTPRRSMAGC